MKKIDFKRAKILFVFAVVCICMVSFMNACSDDSNQNKKNENNKTTTPAVSDSVLDDGKETNKPEATIEATDGQGKDETISTAFPVETDVPTAENTLATDSVVMTPNISATEDVDNSGTIRPIETSKPTVTSGSIETTEPVTTAKPTETTSKPTVKPVATHKNTLKPTAVSSNTPKPTGKATLAPTSTSVIATKAPTVAPTSQPTATAKPTSTPITFPVINATKDSAYNNNAPTVVTVTEKSTKITNNNGGVSQVSNGDIYIKLAGEYDFSGIMKNRSIIVQAPATAKVVINLTGLQLTTAINTPISVLSADKVEISANKETVNVINDNRTTSNPDSASGGAISSDCDLEIKGKGKLNVTSSYNNGIFTKDDLEVKNLTLSVIAPNNALKGNDSVTILSGNITLVALEGNGIETKNFDVSSSGKQRGNIIISAGNINIKAGNDGINAAYSVNVSAGVLIIEATDYSIDATNTIIISANAQFTDKSNKGCNPAI